SRGIRSLEFFDNYVEIIQAAARLDVRIFCVDKPPALYFLYKLGLDRDFRIAFVLNEGAFHRAVKKGRKELLALVDEGFSSIPKADYESISHKWLGAPLSSYVDLQFLAFGVGFVAVVFLGLVAVTWILRRRVASATSELREKLALLEKSEARNRAFISALPDLFFTFDLEGRFLEVNALDEHNLLLPPAAFLGKHIDEVGLPEDIVAAFRHAFSDAREKGGVSLFEYALHLQGQSRLFEGRVVSISADRVLLVSRDITEREAQEERLRSSLREKEVLLKEIHHRVKNNMQVISSLMSLQAGAFRDEKDKELSAETQVRIHAMARIHELLYDSPDLASIDAADYLAILARELAGSYGRSTIDLELESARLTLDEAVPLGLIANELATNALKYAYPQDQNGKILLKLKSEGSSLVLSVEDEGRGLPKSVDPATADSMGFLLVRSLAEQLEAELRFEGPP
ncbi:MAG: histidine kinase dimerization/phosphoacceptor domain -containing protein, partial [Spirochaetaceae bacterium]|nr:histidine kinase dimerization/phosphoacceptor domain -containing protein [Spirochaetaceae bacterium]